MKNYQGNMKKAGKPIPKPTPIVAAAAPAPAPRRAGRPRPPRQDEKAAEEVAGKAARDERPESHPAFLFGAYDFRARHVPN